MKHTPAIITDLAPGQIFAFGSNLAGIHGAGAAKLAHEKFGAKWGCGAGLWGRSYAIPTKDHNIETLELSVIEDYVGGFLRTAALQPQLEFLVTQIGCGLAGYSPKEIAPLFLRREIPTNVSLPAEFWAVQK